ncbi:hypothetical protein L195_g037399, partial [Trifolium pratense]
MVMSTLDRERVLHYIWPSGDKYEGQFVDEKLTGNGIHIWPSGHKYEGGFLDGNGTGRNLEGWKYLHWKLEK